MLAVFKSKGFLLILFKEGHILKLVKFWLILPFTRRMGKRLVKYTYIYVCVCVCVCVCDTIGIDKQIVEERTFNPLQTANL